MGMGMLVFSLTFVALVLGVVFSQFQKSKDKTIKELKKYQEDLESGKIKADDDELSEE